MIRQGKPKVASHTKQKTKAVAVTDKEETPVAAVQVRTPCVGNLSFCVKERSGFSRESKCERREGWGVFLTAQRCGG